MEARIRVERRERRERRGHGKPLQTPSQTRPSPPTSPTPAPPTLPFPSHTVATSSPPTSHNFAPPGRGQTPSTNIRAKRREPLPDLLLLPVHLAEPRVGARRRCAPPGPSSGLWSRRRPWRGGRRGRNDAEALVETVRRHTIAGRNVYAAYLLEVPRSMDLDVE